METTETAMITLYRAEGAHTDPGYAGTPDARTGRYFGTLGKALRYCSPDRHLYEVTVQSQDVVGDPDDHILLTRAQADTKVHSSLCPSTGCPVTAVLGQPLAVWTGMEECPGCRTMHTLITDGVTAFAQGDGPLGQEDTVERVDVTMIVTCGEPNRHPMMRDTTCGDTMTFDLTAPGWVFATPAHLGRLAYGTKVL